MVAHVHSSPAVIKAKNDKAGGNDALFFSLMQELHTRSSRNNCSGNIFRAINILGSILRSDSGKGSSFLSSSGTATQAARQPVYRLMWMLPGFKPRPAIKHTKTLQHFNCSRTLLLTSGFTKSIKNKLEVNFSSFRLERNKG